MKYRIGKTFSFAASHQLVHLPEGHKCRQLHGHTYSVEVVMACDTLNPNGFVCDFGDLTPLSDWIKSTLDHKHLNDILEMPTCEILAYYIWHRWNAIYENLESVRVSESPQTWGEYRR